MNNPIRVPSPRGSGKYGEGVQTVGFPLGSRAVQLLWAWSLCSVDVFVEVLGTYFQSSCIKLTSVASVQPQFTVLWGTSIDIMFSVAAYFNDLHVDTTILNFFPNKLESPR